jgi:hypothetical protein
VLIVTEPDDRRASELLELASPPGRGLAVVVVGRLDDAPWRLSAQGRRWRLTPPGLELDPVTVSEREDAGLAALLAASGAPARVVHPQPRPGDDIEVTVGARPVVPTENLSRGSDVFEATDWAVMVRVLGSVDAVTREGAVVEFERVKSLELVAWLTEHRRAATRAGARAALWETDIRDATFANIVSEARRSLARAVPPPEGVDWIERTLTEVLRLHDDVTSDLAELRRRSAWSQGREPAEVVDVLRPGLELVRDVPYRGLSALWPDAEGLVSAAALLVVTAAIDFAEASIGLDDAAGVFWATAKGLLVVPGHEELVALRMRTHARAGDMAALRQEWESYERVLAGDPWADGEPSPRLAALRADLMGSRTRPTPVRLS